MNIEEVLEHWQVPDAIREVIANALDEQVLTDTKEPEIQKQKEAWHVRDYGRGLRYTHLTQNEDPEKLANPEKVVGKFGVGLKDALATLFRHGVGVAIHSRHCSLSFGMSAKKGFEDVVTLHAIVTDPEYPDITGTDVILNGVADKDVEAAKSYFLKYSAENRIASTQYGNILERKGDRARIYIGGLRVAEEGNFLFSYNITSLTKKLRDALNRERSNVGRAAYSDRVRSILLSQDSVTASQLIVEDLEKFKSGEWHDELQWLDVAVHACRLLNAQRKVVFLTPDEVELNSMLINEARRSGHDILVVPDKVRRKLASLKDIRGAPIRDLGQFSKEYMQSFEFDLVDPEQLSENENAVYEKTASILDLVGGRPAVVREIQISTTMRIDPKLNSETTGVWEARSGLIVIRRDQSRSMESYAGTLLHELAHSLGGADISEEFEHRLTHFLGRVATRAIVH